MDAGEHWYLAVHDPNAPDQGAGNKPDPRPLLRIGGGDLATLAVDPKNENVVYSASIVFWRTENGGVTWSPVRGSPGGDDYQKVWINPNDPNILLLVSDQGAVVSANRGASWSNWYTQSTAAMYHVSTDNSFLYRVCGGQQDSGSACVDSRSMDGEITFHDWHPVDIQEYGIAAPDPKDPDKVFGSMRTQRLALESEDRTDHVCRPRLRAARHELQPQRAHDADQLVADRSRTCCSTLRTRCGRRSIAGTRWTRISPDLARQSWDDSGYRRQVRAAQ